MSSRCQALITIYNCARGRARGVRVIWLCEEMGLPYEVAGLPYPVPECYPALTARPAYAQAQAAAVASPS
jgi:hypothetical protein